jgi:putative ABC transport system substrate-binding protein
LTFEPRSADAQRDRLPALAAELVQLKVDVIVTAGYSALEAARQATATIPIVGSLEASQRLPTALKRVLGAL